MIVEIKCLDCEGKYWHSVGFLQFFPEDGIDKFGALNEKGLDYCNSHDIYSGWEGDSISMSLANLKVELLEFND